MLGKDESTECIIYLRRTGTHSKWNCQVQNLGLYGFFFSILEFKYDKSRLQNEQQVAIKYASLTHTLFAMERFLGPTES